MALPNVNIKLKNGGLGRVSASSDGVTGLILTGVSVVEKLDLNKVYLFSSVRDLDAHGVTKEDNPLIYKEVSAFYTQAGDGATLYLLVVSSATTLTQICSQEAASPLKKLIDYAKGSIRIVGVNRLLPQEYTADTEATGIDSDAVTAATSAQAIAADYAAGIAPFRLLIPAIAWDGTTEKLYKPRESSCNRVGFVMAADDNVSAAIGQVLGRAAAIPVNHSVARVKDGSIAPEGYLTNGKTPEENAAAINSLDAAGYIIYRTFAAKNGYYLNDDAMAAPVSDDYSNLNLGRVIDKAIIIAYTAYIDEVMDSIEVDSSGSLPQYLCTYFEGVLENAVAISMRNEISDFSAYVSPSQNVLSSSMLEIVCKIIPKGMTRNINVTLGFDNPALKK